MGLALLHEHRAQKSCTVEHLYACIVCMEALSFVRVAYASRGIRAAGFMTGAWILVLLEKQEFVNTS